MKLKKWFLGLVGLLVLSTMPAFAQDIATQSFTLTVNKGVLQFVTPPTLPNGQVGLAYTGVSLTVSGGVLPYSFGVTNGSLPAGLALSNAGVFSGTPTTATATPVSFTVTATDSESPAASTSQVFSIMIQQGLVITTTSLPSATVGTSYSATLAASGGIAPYTWSVTVGALPAGLTLNSSTGVISGTPTSSGSFSFTIQVKDSATGQPAAIRVTGAIPSVNPNKPPVTTLVNPKAPAPPRMQ